MSLNISFFDRSYEVTALPGDLAALLEGIAARQVESQAIVDATFVAHWRLLAPLDGAFNGPMARALIRWRDG